MNPQQAWDWIKNNIQLLHKIIQKAGIYTDNPNYDDYLQETILLTYKLLIKNYQQEKGKISTLLYISIPRHLARIQKNIFIKQMANI